MRLSKRNFFSIYSREPVLLIGGVGLLIIGQMVLRSIAPEIYPSYLFYILAGSLVFILFSQIDFDILQLFAPHLYVVSLLSLFLPLIIGEVTRGATRWIQVGSITVQPTELVKPFLILFFAYYLAGKKLDPKRVLSGCALFILPLILIVLQPSLGVSVLVFSGLVGVVLTLKYNKKLLILVGFLAALASPLMWFLLAPYQKQRIVALFSPLSDPAGAGYNSIQSMIAVGSGKLFGRGLGEGVQTQLYFLPERHSDFIFASIAEELGFMGALLTIALIFFVMWRIIVILENTSSPVARAFVAGIFVTFFVQIIVHIGMNMGLLPITGLPLPLVSAGGSSLVATMAIFGMLLRAKSDENAKW